MKKVYQPTKLIFGVLTFLPGAAELATERLLASGFLVTTLLLVMLTAFRKGALELEEELEDRHKELEVLELLREVLPVAEAPEADV